MYRLDFKLTEGKMRLLLSADRIIRMSLPFVVILLLMTTTVYGAKSPLSSKAIDPMAVKMIDYAFPDERNYIKDGTDSPCKEISRMP